MGQCETLTVSNMLANEWAIRSLILGLRGVVVLWTPCLFNFRLSMGVLCPLIHFMSLSVALMTMAASNLRRSPLRLMNQKLRSLSHKRLQCSSLSNKSLLLRQGALESAHQHRHQRLWYHHSPGHKLSTVSMRYVGATQPQWVNSYCTNFNRNSNIFIKKNTLKMSSAKQHPFCVVLNVLNVSSWGPICVWDPALVITLSADGPAPNGTTPSADTVCSMKWDVFSFKVSLANNNLGELIWP